MLNFIFEFEYNKQKLKHEFGGINGDQTNSGLITSYNLSKNKLWNEIYWLYSKPIRNDTIVKLLSDVFWSYSVFRQIFVSLKWSITGNAFSLHQRHIYTENNLLSWLFNPKCELVILVIFSESFEQYEKNIKTSCYYCRAL